MPDPHVVVGLYTRPVFTVATLPTTVAQQQGEIRYITDSTTNPATTTGQVAVGGGTTRTRVMSDGTVWRVYGWA